MQVEVAVFLTYLLTYSLAYSLTGLLITPPSDGPAAAADGFTNHVYTSDGPAAAADGITNHVHTSDGPAAAADGAVADDGEEAGGGQGPGSRRSYLVITPRDDGDEAGGGQGPGTP